MPEKVSLCKGRQAKVGKYLLLPSLGRPGRERRVHFLLLGGAVRKKEPVNYWGGGHHLLLSVQEFIALSGEKTAGRVRKHTTRYVARRGKGDRASVSV